MRLNADCYQLFSNFRRLCEDRSLPVGALPPGRP